MKKFVCVIIAILMAAACAYAEDAGTEAWTHEAGWMNFSLALAQDGLDEVWNEAAATFGASLGLAGLGGAQLKSMILLGHQLENDVEELHVEGNRFIAKKADGTVLFDREYSLAESIQEENILNGEKVSVFRTEDADAGEYKYLLLTEPQTTEGTNASYITFNLVCTGKDDYRSLFDTEKSGEAVAVCAMIEKDITDEGLMAAIEKLFSNPVVITRK